MLSSFLPSDGTRTERQLRHFPTMEQHLGHPKVEGEQAPRHCASAEWRLSDHEVVVRKDTRGVMSM